MALKKELSLKVSGLEKLSSAMKELSKAQKDTLEFARETAKAFQEQAEEKKKQIASQKKENDLLARKKEILARMSREDAEKERSKRAKDPLAALREAKELEKLREGEIPWLEKLQNLKRYKGLSGAISYIGEKKGEASREELLPLEADIKSKESAEASARSQLEAAQAAVEKARSSGKLLKSGKLKYTKKQQEALDQALAERDQKSDALEKAETATRSAKRAKAAREGKIAMQARWFSALAKSASMVDKAFRNLVISPLQNFKKEIWTSIQSMADWRTGAATYSAGSSLITNASAREEQMKYGLTSAQAYGFAQAKSMLNIRSDEDLMFMNEGQRERLLSYMSQYTAWFERMESSGVLSSIQEMQLEFEELKRELAMDFLEWIANNKDTIIGIAKGIWSVVKAIFDAVTNLLSIFGFGKADLYSSAEASDKSAVKFSQPTNNVTINANTTNNATGVLGSAEALEKFSQDNWSVLAKQIVTAIGG